MVYTQLSFREVPWIHCLAIGKLELLSLSYTNYYLDFTGTLNTHCYRLGSQSLLCHPILLEKSCVNLALEEY